MEDVKNEKNILKILTKKGFWWYSVNFPFKAYLYIHLYLTIRTNTTAD